jgi:hypothetical protein
MCVYVCNAIGRIAFMQQSRPTTLKALDLSPWYVQAVLSLTCTAARYFSAQMKPSHLLAQGLMRASAASACQNGMVAKRGVTSLKSLTGGSMVFHRYHCIISHSFTGFHVLVSRSGSLVHVFHRATTSPSHRCKLRVVRRKRGSRLREGMILAALERRRVMHYSACHAVALFM